MNESDPDKTEVLMPVVHLIEGPVGAGKSTFAAALARQRHAVHLNLDDWMARLFRPDRPSQDVMPWYLQRKARCLEQIWVVAQAIMATGGHVVLELGLIQRQGRLGFYQRVAASGGALELYVLDASREIRRARVQTRNTDKGATFAMEVPDAIFEMASDMWEPVDAAEAEGRKLHWVDNSGPVAVTGAPPW